MKGNHDNHLRGGEHYRWNRGRLRSSEGYAKLRVGVDHPLADPNGYAYEHLVVWVAAGNPRPRPDQVLRFKNGDKGDCRLGNLKLEPRRVLLAKNNVGIAQDRSGRFVSEAQR
jgi:hypothetical protein